MKGKSQRKDPIRRPVLHKEDTEKYDCELRAIERVFSNRQIELFQENMIVCSGLDVCAYSVTVEIGRSR